jgi:hypothetical protein
MVISIFFVGAECCRAVIRSPLAGFIYRNDTQNGKIKFTEVSKEIAPSLQNIGLVCDAIWSDADNDGDPDIIIAGEWMPITI